MDTHDELRAWLDDHINLETGVGVPSGRDRRGAPTLERIRELVELLGTPQREYPVVHLTGTNGKTSTARLCVALLDALGLTAGSYTSPHLQRVNERIARGGEPIDDDALDDLLAVVRLAERQVDAQPSYFEVLTAAALRWFADEAVDVAVVEVGLGGTWDATSVVDGRVAVVTNVSVDHVDYLGSTREEIARDKAGIVREGATLVLGETDPDLEGLFLARRPGAVVRRDTDFAVRRNVLAHGGRLVDLATPRASYEEVFLALHGAHQADNAAAALATIEAFTGAAVPDTVVRSAFASVRVPGRLEVVGRRPLVVLDGAHNVAGAEAMRVALAAEFPHASRTLVVGLLREKDPDEMLAALGVDDASRLVCCRPPSPRALDPEEVARAAERLGVPEEHIEVCDTVKEAVGAARLVTPEDGEIVVSGSLYVVGAARAVLVAD